MVPGGKGGSMAVQLRRLGTYTYMIGCVGSDDFQRTAQLNLIASEVDVSRVRRVPNCRTGLAVILASNVSALCVLCCVCVCVCVCFVSTRLQKNAKESAFLPFRHVLTPPNSEQGENHMPVFWSQ